MFASIWKKICNWFDSHAELVFDDVTAIIDPITAAVAPAVFTAPVMAAAAPVAAAPAASANSVTTGPTIAVTNLSTKVTDAQVQAACAAIQIQVNRDFAPAWGFPATITFVPSTAKPVATNWIVQVLDHTDQANALGYHEMNSVGIPLAKVFAADDIGYGLSWTVTLSHEILEMIGDPFIDTTVFAQNSMTTGTLFAFEMCDAVEDDSMGYLINGVLVSNFVLPPYFEANRAPNSTKFDFCGHLSAPLSIAHAGYASEFPVNPTTTGWTQRVGAEMGPRLKSKQGRPESRGAIRKMPRA